MSKKESLRVGDRVHLAITDPLTEASYGHFGVVIYLHDVWGPIYYLDLRYLGKKSSSWAANSQKRDLPTLPDFVDCDAPLCWAHSPDVDILAIIPPGAPQFESHHEQAD